MAPVAAHDGLDDATVHFLLAQTLLAKQQEDEEVRAEELREWEDKVGDTDSGGGGPAAAGRPFRPHNPSQPCLHVVCEQERGLEDTLAPVLVSAQLPSLMPLTILDSSWFVRPLVSGSYLFYLGSCLTSTVIRVYSGRRLSGKCRIQRFLV